MEWHINSVSGQHLSDEQRRKLPKLLKKVQAAQQYVVPCNSVFGIDEDLEHINSFCARIAACSTTFRLMFSIYCYAANACVSVFGARFGATELSSI